LPVDPSSAVVQTALMPMVQTDFGIPDIGPELVHMALDTQQP
jgi:hypothetical protein